MSLNIKTVWALCDDCGKMAHCALWRDTHFLICPDCGLSKFRIDDFILKEIEEDMENGST